ncbi:hypothetical protein EJ110_NYTH02009 [Nymphaea thermarum]|nr:hypothetical protein EJ110_NYTH02009 [Nymphaea thermarum]
MVKFSKELEARLVPEWKEAFCDYRALKQNVKRIKLLGQKSKSAHHGHNTASADPYARVSIFSPFRYMGTKIADMFFSKADEGGLIIQAREDEESRYHRDLATLFTEENEVKEFFARLDEQLNKVNQFYESKEAEFLERGHILKKQLDVLLDLKRLLHDRQRRVSSASEPCSDCGKGLTVVDATGKVKTNEDGTKGRKEEGRRGLPIELPAMIPRRAISALTQGL